MSHYFIHIDSSVENNKQTSTAYGSSTVAWTVRCNGEIVIRAGVIYSHFNGPNKIIYEGILSALASLEPGHFYSGGFDNVFVYIDSEIVLDQINQVKGSVKMKRHLNLVKKLQERLPNVKFDFSYKNDKNPEFKEVDILSKQSRRWIPKIVTSIKK